VSVLEGGYNTKAWAQSPLAQSVQAHVRALLDGTRERAELALPELDRQSLKRFQESEKEFKEMDQR
jgi:hypothetical protein